MFLEVSTKIWVDEDGPGVIEVAPELYAQLMGREFDVVDGVPVLTAKQRRLDLKAAATAKRWSVETGGITLPNGLEVHTAKDDQDRITSTIAGMAAVGIASVDFKAASGWTTLTLDDLRTVRAAIALHVQACFSAERAHHEAIDALTDAELDAYDISQGWPA